MPYEYFYNREPEQYVHYQMPSILFEDDNLRELSINAKFLYSVLLDRAKLSYKNGWLDDDGKVYIHYAQADLIKLLNCGRTKMSEYFNELDGDKGGVGLIERKQKVGIGKNDKIYVKNFAKPTNESIGLLDTPQSPFDYFHNMEGLRFSHYQIPKMLFTDERIKDISNIAKMAYSFLLDRTALSYKNDWRDKNGRVYVLFPQKELQELLGCSIRTVKSALSELDINNGVGLIDRTRQGQNSPDMIYVLDFGTNLKYQNEYKKNKADPDIDENQRANCSVNIGGANPEHREVQNLNIGGAKSEHREVQNLNIGGAKSEHHYNNNTNISHTDSNNTHSVSQNPHVQESKSNSNRQTDGLEHEKMKFSDILTALGINWIDRISHEPHSEKSFEHYDEKDRNTKNCTLPYNLKSDKAAMTEAIKYLFAYSYYATGLAESNKKLLDTVIREISEMTEKEKQTLDKEVVGYNDIIDKINEINHNYSLIDWFNSFEQKWTEIISQRGNEIKNKRAYLKSCIWNWLKDFQFDAESNFRASESISDSSTENKYEIFMNAF